jgi:hypothetical protein
VVGKQGCRRHFAVVARIEELLSSGFRSACNAHAKCETKAEEQKQHTGLVVARWLDLLLVLLGGGVVVGGWVLRSSGELLLLDNDRTSGVLLLLDNDTACDGNGCHKGAVHQSSTTNEVAANGRHERNERHDSNDESDDGTRGQTRTTNSRNEDQQM